MLCQPLLAADVTFIALHPNPGQHFASLAQTLRDRGLKVDVYASEKALEVLNRYGVEAINFHPTAPLIHTLEPEQQQKLANTIVTKCASSKHIVTDIGEGFFTLLHQALEKEYQGRRWAYYDNPQSYVNSIYSKLAGDIAKTGARFLFANAALEESGVRDEHQLPIPATGIGIGFFPMEDVASLQQAKWEREAILNKLPEDWRKRRLFIYVGAANEEYYQSTFPHIMALLAQTQEALADCLILLQQHPRAQQEGDRDGQLVDANTHLPIKRSPLSTFEGAAISEVMLYSDTTFAMRAELAGISISKIDQSTSPEGLIQALKKNATTPRTAEELVGYRPDWHQRLIDIFTE